VTVPVDCAKAAVEDIAAVAVVHSKMSFFTEENPPGTRT
jgi:hypothetical protein